MSLYATVIELVLYTYNELEFFSQVTEDSIDLQYRLLWKVGTCFHILSLHLW